MKEMTTTQFKELAQNCIDDLNVIGIYPKITVNEISISRRLKSTFGHCVYTWKKVDGEYDFKTVKIEISYRLLTDENQMRNTLYHELLHACKECINHHHGGQWKIYADLVTDCYGTSIERCGNWNETTAIKVGKEFSWASDGVANAISLDDGTLSYFDKNDSIVPIKTKIVNM